jgi:hypothetical protein
MVNVKSVILKEQVKKYWADSSKSIVDRKILNEYVKGDFNIELIEEIGFFTNNVEDIMNYKTIVKVFNNGKLVKRKLFWMGYDKWNGFTHDMLVSEVFKSIN